MATKQKPKKRIIRPVSRVCEFCESKTIPDYKDYKTLAKYLTDRAKIMGKDFTGLCSKHQRGFTVAVKRARHLSLLPFISTVK